MKNTRGYNGAPKKCVLYSEEERVTGGHRGTDVTKQVKDTPPQHETIRTPPDTCNKGVSYSRIQETSRKVARKSNFPGSKSQPYPSIKPYRDHDV
jgi:hypothetical protein